MTHLSRLTRELRALLHSHRVAALGTISDGGHPFVSMVPFAMAPALGCFVIHVSGLAAHTKFLAARPVVSLLVMQRETPGEPVHALPRATLEGHARLLEPDSDRWQACRAAYLQRFPEAEHMTQLGDFRFVAIEVKGARQVAGFGSARSIDEQEVRLALSPEEQ
jgi:heme oxygenase (biliverdin-IX-beta and delta-forming)